MSTESLLEAATQKHRAGDLPEARRLYLLVLERSPTHPPAMFRFGLLELQENRPIAALALISRAAAAMPDEPRYQLGLGQTFSALRRWADAEPAYRRAILLEPTSADARYELGNLLASAGDHLGAIAAYQSALQLQPDLVDACINMGNCHHKLQNLPRAAAAYEQALRLQSNRADAMSNLGVVLNACGEKTRALEHLRAAVELEPLAAIYAVNLGAALCDQLQFAEAVCHLRQAVRLDPVNAHAAFNLGNALQGLGDLPAAKNSFRNAVALQPDFADALNNLGNVLKELGEFALAMEAYQSAIRSQPGFLTAINNTGCLLRTLGKLQEAETMLRHGLEIDPANPALFDNLANVLKDTGRLDEAIDCYRRSLSLDGSSWGTHSNLAYALSFSSMDGQSVLDECLRWNQRHALPPQREIPSHSNDRSPNRRLRIGYVSPDFRVHCQSLFTIPLLLNHKHEKFEIFCYSSVERPDHLTRRIAGYADVWRDVRPLDDAALAELIRADGIDILIDLTMHMASGRPLMFARKPAPVQIAWLAYPGTTGISAMDYRLSDPRLDPAGFDGNYSERTIRLPDSFWCYDPLTDEPEVNPLPALERGYLTLGCLNNPCKLTDATLQLWSGVMAALPASRLMLMAPPGSYRRHLLNRLAAHAVAADRIDFVSYRPRADYLRSYHQIDLGLDTFPYNGHTTSLDSFWMGVPVITRVGQTCVGRGGLSQLFQLDLAELAADSDSAFVNIAAALANDLRRLTSLRQQLRLRLEGSPLMNGRRFSHSMEAVYRGCWDEYLGRG